jgi:hypothetical protein
MEPGQDAILVFVAVMGNVFWHRKCGLVSRSYREASARVGNSSAPPASYTE